MMRYPPDFVSACRLRQLLRAIGGAKRLEQVEGMSLNSPPVNRVAAGKVARGGGVALEQPQQPVKTGLAELAAVGVA
jgi:hypothetical protein